MAERAVDIDRAAGALDQRLHHGEAQTGATVRGLGGEEWLEDASANRFGHARAGVAERDADGGRSMTPGADGEAAAASPAQAAAPLVSGDATTVSAATSTTGDTRRVTNVAAGTVATDASTVGQGNNRVGVGVGNYGGQSALSVGYQRAFANNHASISIGASASGSESSVGLGGGFSW